jgi:hypothetical protein
MEQYVSPLPHTNRSRLVPVLTALLGAAVATATFALINIDDESSSVSSGAAVVQPAAPSDASQRYDGGPVEGAAQQTIAPQALSAGATTVTGFNGGPVEGAAQQSIAPQSTSAPATGFNGGPVEGAAQQSIAPPPEDSAGANTIGARP